MEVQPLPLEPVSIRLAAETTLCFDLPHRSSMTLMEVAGQIYRIEFWPDRIWHAIPDAIRPKAIRAHSEDGWFLVSAVVDFLTSLPPLG